VAPEEVAPKEGGAASLLSGTGGGGPGIACNIASIAAWPSS